MKSIKLNKSYINNKTNKKCHVYDICKFKSSGMWVECIIYTDQSGEKFVVKSEYFRKNFSEVVREEPTPTLDEILDIVGRYYI